VYDVSNLHDPATTPKKDHGLSLGSWSVTRTRPLHIWQPSTGTKTHRSPPSAVASDQRLRISWSEGISQTRSTGTSRSAFASTIRGERESRIARTRGVVSLGSPPDPTPTLAATQRPWGPTLVPWVSPRADGAPSPRRREATERPIICACTASKMATSQAPARRVAVIIIRGCSA
jgi:hypothetical protein